MGAGESRNPNFVYDSEFYRLCIDKLDEESPKQVYNRLTSPNFRNRKEMWAVAILIYEKAVTQPEFSMKCALLVKELEAETHDEDLYEFFHVVFWEFFWLLIQHIVNVYRDGIFSNGVLNRIRRAATFIGNLYLTDVYSLHPIFDIAKIVKPIETPRNKFFLETLIDVIADKMKREFDIDRENFYEVAENIELKHWLKPVHHDSDTTDNSYLERLVDYINELNLTDF